MSNIYNSFIKINLLISLFMLNSKSFASEENLIIVTRLYPPYIYNEGDEIKGISANIIRSVFKKMNQKIEIYIRPWTRSHNEIETGKADIIFTVNKSPERDKIMTYNNVPIIYQNMTFYKKAKNNTIFNGDYKNLKNKTIGFTRGAFYGESFMKGIKKYNLTTEECWDYEKCILKLNSNRYDVIIGSERVVEYFINKLKVNKNEFTKINPKVQTITSYLGFSKKKDYAKIKNTFDVTLTKMKDTGEYDKIIQKSVASINDSN